MKNQKMIKRTINDDKLNIIIVGIEVRRIILFKKNMDAPKMGKIQSVLPPNICQAKPDIDLFMNREKRMR